MNKNKIIFFVLLVIVVFLLIFILFGFNRKEYKDMYLDCDTNYISQDELSCSLYGDVSDYEVAAVSSTILESDDFDLVEVIPDSSWEGDGENGHIDLYTDKNKKDKFLIATFKILLTSEKVDEIRIEVSNNIYFDENFKEHNLEDIEKILEVRR